MAHRRRLLRLVVRPGAAAVVVTGLRVALVRAALAAFASDRRHVLAIAADGLAALATDARHVLAVPADGLAAAPTDRRHVVAVLRHALAAFFARLPGFVGRELVRGP